MYTEAPTMQNPGDLRIPDGVDPKTIQVDGTQRPVTKVLILGTKGVCVDPSLFDEKVPLPGSSDVDEEAVLLETTF